MKILKSAFEFQLPPHSKPWPEVCRTVDVLGSNEKSLVIAGNRTQERKDP